MSTPVEFGTPKVRVESTAPQTFVLPKWGSLPDDQKVAAIRKISEAYARDPRIAALAVKIFRKSGVAPRDFRGQAQALLKWVQQNIYYVNEPGERLQSPIYTLGWDTNSEEVKVIRVPHGDCDDEAVLLATLFGSVRIPYRYVLSGIHNRTQEKIRWVEGEPMPRDVSFSHIYLACGLPPHNPTEWIYCEPTLRKVPLGWDVVSAAESRLPEMQSRLSPAIAGPEDFGVSTATAAGVNAGAAAGADSSGEDINWNEVKNKVIVGVCTGVLTTLILQFLSPKG